MRIVRAFSLFGLVAVAGGAAADPRLVGAWTPTVYHIQGKDHPMEGLFIFTESHFSTNVRFQQSSGALDDSNANAGTYRVEGDKLILTSQLAAHIRPGNSKEPIHYNRGGVESATFRIEGDRLIITFPSKNRYEAQRVK